MEWYHWVGVYIIINWIIAEAYRRKDISRSKSKTMDYIVIQFLGIIILFISLVQVIYRAIRGQG